MQTNEIHTNEIQAIREQLDGIYQLLLLQTKNVYTTAEIARYLDVTEGRIRSMVCAHEIPHYKRGNRTFFRREDIEAWQCGRRVETNEEIERAAEAYVAAHPRRPRS